MHHRVYGIFCLVADGKDAQAALHLRRHALRLEEGTHVLIRKAADRAVQKRAIAADIMNDFRNLRRVRDIAASLPRNHHFASGDAHFFEQRDRRPMFSRLDGRHHAGGSRAYDKDCFHMASPARRRRPCTSSSVRKRYAPRLTPSSESPAKRVRARLLTSQPTAANIRLT